MRAVRYVAPETIKVEDIPVPSLGPGEALVKVAYTGLCGSDLPIYKGIHPRVKPPLVVGHEIAGTLAEINAEGYNECQVGDLVAVNPLLFCGHCQPCRTGNWHVCKTLGLTGIDADGGFAEYVKVPVHQLVKLNPEIPMDRAALTEPVAVAVHAIRRSKMQLGDAVAVLGAGPIGLLVAFCARLAGASQVLITDVSDFRLGVAKDFGFTPIDARQDAVKQIQDLTGGNGADVVFEVVGAAPTAADMIQAVKITGTVVIVGVFKQPAPVDLRTVNFNELAIIGTRVYTDFDFRTAARMVYQYPELGKIITSRLPLEEAQQAFNLGLSAATSNALKVLMHP
ncbi:MAG: alcohol dehydrogenase catalytic domain-containing protein [Clostridia bacterium]|nr:alcohol dehydrogenase catalytic domain-containing protein [Clostridia bacterium]